MAPYTIKEIKALAPPPKALAPPRDTPKVGENVEEDETSEGLDPNSAAARLATLARKTR